MQISHVGIPVADIARSKAFYDLALAPLGMKVIMTVGPDKTESGGTAIGYASGEKDDSFWIGDNETVGKGIHIAFAAETRDQVEAFYAAALAAGGKDNGAPGLREKYGPDYYAAFVHDPDGVNVEAVCMAAG